MNFMKFFKIAIIESILEGESYKLTHRYGDSNDLFLVFFPNRHLK